MPRRRYNIFLFLLPVLTDALLIFVSFVLSYRIRFFSGWFYVTKGIPSLSYYLWSSVFVIVVWGVIFYLSGLYETEKIRSFADELYELTKGAIIGSAVVLAPTFFYRPFTYSRLFLAIAFVLSFILVSTGRYGLKRLKGFYHRKGRYLRRTAIVGGGEMGNTIWSAIKRSPALGYEVVGHILGEPGNGCIGDLVSLGTIDDIAEIVKRQNLDTLIMTFPLHSQHKVSKILLGCKDSRVDFLFAPDLYEMMTSRVTLYEIGGVPLFGLREFPLDGWYGVVKRGADVVLSIFLLTITMSVFVMISMLIKLTSKGAALYWQERVGQGGEIFYMPKFRSMVHEAERDTGPVWAVENDERVTKLGRFLRYTRLDELPQLLSVLKGDMSLIGPRPERPYFVERIWRELADYGERLKVKPGLTGLAQVRHRYDTSIDDVKVKLEYDLYYAENASFKLDLEILLKTIPVILRGEGAH